MARAFRAEMLASDQTLTGSVRAIVRSIEARLGRKRTLRREHVIDIVRSWKTLRGAEYRLQPVEVLDTKRVFGVSEVRASAGRVINPEWVSPELGVVITRVGLRVQSGRLTTEISGSTVVSGHALGRRSVSVKLVAARTS